MALLAIESREKLERRAVDIVLALGAGGMLEGASKGFSKVPTAAPLSNAR